MPENIGSFEVIREIGKSELGTIYKAHDPKKERTVALRLLPTGTPEDSERSRQYLLHAKAASVLDSPNIATIYEAAEEQGLAYVAMEFVEGIPLDTALSAQQGFSSSELLDISRQVCRGLDHAHSKGIFHRWLTPSGILTEWDGTVKITDFAADPGPLEEKRHELCYMSPEQVQGRVPDARSNVFNWGAILYEMVTGRKAFGNGDSEGALREILEAMPPSPNELNPKVPVGISRTIMKALAKNPDYRFQRAGDLVSELEAECEAASRPVISVPQVNAPPAQPPQPAPPPAEAASTTPYREPLLGYDVPPPAAPAVSSVPAMARSSIPAQKKTQETIAPIPQPRVAASSDPVSLTPKQVKILVGVIGAALVLMVSVVIADGVRGRRMRAEAEAAAAAPLVGTAAPENFTVNPIRVPEPVPEAQTTVLETAPPAKIPRARRKAVVAPAAAVAPGGLVISSVPDGAQVQMDGNAAGLTPLSLANVTPGQHLLVLSKTGYTTESRSVLVQSGTKAALAVSLNQLAAMAAIASDPPGASIIVDGHDTGKLTPAKVVVERGLHSFVLRKPGYLDTSTSMALNPGETFQFAPTLKPLGNADDIRQAGKFKKLIGRSGPENSARVLVRTFPKGAQIMFNARMMDRTSPAEFLLGPGTYNVTLSLTGYKPVHKTITVESNGRMEVNETFER